MHSKVFVKLKKTLKPSRPGKKTQKNPKKPKKPKKTHWAGFFKKKTGFFPTLVCTPLNRGGGANSSTGEGVGESQFGRLEKKPCTLSTLCTKV
jgi:hypothetical protein